MCQHTVILAERAGHRYVSQCEHGTVQQGEGSLDAFSIETLSEQFTP